MTDRRTQAPARRLTRRYLVVTVVFCLMAAGVLAEQVRLSMRMDRLAPPLQRPLAEVVPLTIGSWKCRDDLRLSPGETTILEPEDYLLRRYVNLADGQQLNLFVPFSRKAETAIGHEPDVCYGGAGFALVDRSEAVVPYTYDGQPRHIDMGVMTFSRNQSRQLVLFGYLLSSGRATTNPLVVRLEKALQALTGRRPASLMKVQLQLQPVPGKPLDEARREALDFVAELMPHLEAAMPRADRSIDTVDAQKNE